MRPPTQGHAEGELWASPEPGRLVLQKERRFGFGNSQGNRAPVISSQSALWGRGAHGSLWGGPCMPTQGSV